MTPEDRESLVDALCEVAYVQDREGQSDLLSCLPLRIRREVGTGPVYRFALRLVTACETQGTLLPLVRWVLRKDARSVAAEALAAEAAPYVREAEDTVLGSVLVDAATAGAATVSGDLATVRAELALLPCEPGVRETYRSIRADHAGKGGGLPPPETAWEALVNLALLPAFDDPSPAARFCAWLAAAHPALSCADLLGQWGGALGAAPLPAPAPEDLPARLVVRVSRSCRDRYDLESWSVLSDGRGGPPDFAEHWMDRDVPGEEISVRVGSRLDLLLADSRSAHHRSTRVELVTSLDLMAEAVAERWQNGRTLQGRPLGERAEVVYRDEALLDRRSPEVRSAQKRFSQRWSGLFRDGRAAVFDLFHTADMNERLIAKRLDDDRVIGISVPRGLGEVFLSVALAVRSGVPVVIWHFGDSPRPVGSWLSPVQMEREVTVSPDDMSELPAALLRSRSGRVSPSDYGYIESSSQIAVIYHDTLPVLPPPPPPMSHRSIQ
ncbi:hypothetical protein IDM40_06465 [Nocardiopsis sp. HNM0947]|uniref:Uncharacterized protein n=1 Tax=Nocardiopsis coralli TaxID=2772213 RepID=A0ABR9P3H2_9ACTN|nr:hypothetical protein [Nocardiopsis coralli]MBE2998350.1 hypothetical protein [Nocardiopsis coralli]